MILLGYGNTTRTNHTQLLEVVVIIMVICLVVLLIEINESCNIFDVKQKVK